MNYPDDYQPEAIDFEEETYDLACEMYSIPQDKEPTQDQMDCAYRELQSVLEERANRYTGEENL
jgi:hypothetical protein